MECMHPRKLLFRLTRPSAIGKTFWRHGSTAGEPSGETPYRHVNRVLLHPSGTLPVLFSGWTFRRIVFEKQEWLTTDSFDGLPSPLI